MRRPSSALARLSLLPTLVVAACLSQPTALPADGGTTSGGNDGTTSTTDTGTTAKSDTGTSSGTCDPDAGASLTTLQAANTADSTVDITYCDGPTHDVTQCMGCSTAGLSTRTNIDGTPASYTPASIPGYPCAAKEYLPTAGDDTSKNIVVLVHGNSDTPTEWETYVNDSTQTPMIADRLKADGYHVYASDVRYDLVGGNPEDANDAKNNTAKNYDYGWSVPIIQSLLTNLFTLYPAPRQFNLMGFSIGPGVIRDALRRMFREGLNPYARIHAIHLASGANHGVSTYEASCGDQADPLNTTMAGLITCQMGDRTNFVITPFMTPLNGAQQDISSFDTPCADGNTAYGLTGVCGCNKVVYSTVVFADPETGPLLDEFVSQKSAALVGADNMSVTEPEPGTCPAGSTTNCQGYFFYPNFKYHFGAVRGAQGVQMAVTALESHQ